MRCHHDSGAACVNEFKQFDNLGRQGWIQISGRLIRQQDDRAIHNRTCNADPLLLACREARRKLISLMLDTDRP
jgi:hypothetical protein